MYAAILSTAIRHNCHYLIIKNAVISVVVQPKILNRCVRLQKNKKKYEVKWQELIGEGVFNIGVSCCVFSNCQKGDKPPALTTAASSGQTLLQKTVLISIPREKILIGALI